MAHFKYSGRSRQGERVEGVVEAADRASAVREIESAGHIPVSIVETTKTVRQSNASAGKRFRFELGFHRSPRMKMQDLLLFSRELSDLVASGMTIGRALHTLAARDDPSATGQIITTLRDEIIQGTSLSDALALYPETFSPLYTNLVRAGEASGNLVHSLENICTHYERVHEARGKVISAMIYPAIVMLIGLLAVIGMMTFMVPQFRDTFADLGATLPAPTRFLMKTSDLFMRFGPIVLPLLIALFIAFRKWIKQGTGQRFWHRSMLRIPIMRSIVTANAYAHFARTLGTLLQNGVSVLPALAIVQKTVTNVILSDEIGKARARVTDGSTISRPLAQGQVFPRLMTDMIAIGEETGNLAGSLQHITRRYDAELDRVVKICTTILEPVLLLIVAVMVGSIAVCLLLPVLRLTDTLGI